MIELIPTDPFIIALAAPIATYYKETFKRYNIAFYDIYIELCTVHKFPDETTTDINTFITTDSTEINVDATYSTTTHRIYAQFTDYNNPNHHHNVIKAIQTITKLNSRSAVFDKKQNKSHHK